jgi:hypothetical protein
MWQFKVFSPKSKQAKHQKVILKSVPRTIKQNAGMQKTARRSVRNFKAQNFNNIAVDNGNACFYPYGKTSAMTSR